VDRRSDAADRPRPRARQRQRPHQQPDGRKRVQAAPESAEAVAGLIVACPYAASLPRARQASTPLAMLTLRAVRGSAPFGRLRRGLTPAAYSRPCEAIGTKDIS
jgi:hypothetical protein